MAKLKQQGVLAWRQNYSFNFYQLTFYNNTFPQNWLVFVLIFFSFSGLICLILLCADLYIFVIAKD